MHHAGASCICRFFLSCAMLATSRVLEQFMPWLRIVHVVFARSLKNVFLDVCMTAQFGLPRTVCFLSVRDLEEMIAILTLREWRVISEVGFLLHLFCRVPVIASVSTAP